MDSKKFFQEIRKIIREEVSRAMVHGSTIHENIQRLDSAPPKHTETKVKTSNTGTTLEELLNETRENMTHDRTINFTSQDAVGFNKNNYAEMLGYGDMSGVKRGSIPLPQTDINNMPVHQMDPTVEHALTKNYSALMKALKDKKKI